jgi:hypothetical protein
LWAQDSQGSDDSDVDNVDADIGDAGDAGAPEIAPLPGSEPQPGCGAAPGQKTFSHLFCGVGLTSAGLVTAGMFPVHAMDFDAEVLGVHRRLFTACSVYRVRLGEGGLTAAEVWAWIKQDCRTRGIPLRHHHIHMSPPQEPATEMLETFCLELCRLISTAGVVDPDARGVTLTIAQMHDKHDLVLSATELAGWNCRVLSCRELRVHSRRDIIITGTLNVPALETLAAKRKLARMLTVHEALHYVYAMWRIKYPACPTL